MLPSMLAGFAGYDTPRAVFPSIVDVLGDSTGAVLVQGDMPVVVTLGALGQTAQKTVEIPQLPFFDKVVQISCRGAEADSHGPDCSVRRTTGIPHLQFLTEVIDVPVVQVVQLLKWWSQLLFSDTLVTCPLLSTTGVWCLRAPNHCGGPQLPFFACRRYPCRGPEADSHSLLARKTMETPHLLYFPGGRCPCSVLSVL